MNKLLDKLEKKYGQYALEGLMKYIAGLMILVYILHDSNLLSYNMINLCGAKILKGELWRIFTFALIPESNNVIFLIFEISILFMCAEGLESKWGTFKLSIYYVMGLIMISIASLIYPNYIFPGSYFIYLDLFLAFSTIYPDYEIYLFMILPLKVKYFAFLSVILLLYAVIQNVVLAIPFALALGNYLLFFGSEVLEKLSNKQRQKEYDRKFVVSKVEETGYRHKCTVCGKTDVSSPETQFRYCTCEKCGKDGICYCLEHLKEHKQNNQNNQNK